MPSALRTAATFRISNEPDDGTNDDAVAIGVNRRASMPRVSFLTMEADAEQQSTPYLLDYTAAGVLRSDEVQMQDSGSHSAVSSTAGLRNSQIFASEQALGGT